MYNILVLLFDGLLATSSSTVCDTEADASASAWGPSKILDLASQRAFVTGEWYIPGQRLIGFLIDDPASMWWEVPSVEATMSGIGGSELASVMENGLIW